MAFLSTAKRRRAAAIAASIFWGALAPAADSVLHLGPYVVVSGAIAAIILTIVWGFGPRRPWLVFWSALALSAVAAGFWLQPPPSPPSVEDLNLSFLIDKIVGDRVYGHVSLHNGARTEVRITDSYLVVSSWFAANDTNPDKVLSPGHTTEFFIDHPNDLALRGGDVTLTFDVAFGDKPQTPQPAEVAFTIPANPMIGRTIPPSRCCRAQPKDLYATGLKEAEARLDLDQSYFEIPALGETDIDGYPMVISVPRDKHRFFVSNGLVRFDSFQGGAWRELKLPFQQTTNHKHFIKFGWSDKAGISWLVVDNAGIAGGIKHDNVVSIPPRELLAHEG